MKNTRRKRLSVSMLLMVSAIVLGGCSDTTESSSKTVKGLELSDYIGMTEATFLAETGFEKKRLWHISGYGACSRNVS